MWWILACAPAIVDSGKPPEPGFCSTVAEAGVIEDTDCADCALSSARIVVRLVTDVGLDPLAPEYTTYKDWTMSPANGGVAQAGTTDGDGRMALELGAGLWSFESSFLRGGRVCAATLELDAAAGHTLSGCALMSCPAE